MREKRNGAVEALLARQMSATPRRIIVVEDDPFLRLIQVILDPATAPERVAAFDHFMAHDEPDFAGWCERMRFRIPSLYPAAVRLAGDSSELRARLPGAQIAVVEALGVGSEDIAAAGGALRIVQKYGTITSSIDRAACERAGVSVVTLRRRANIATAEHAFALLLALARRLVSTANLVSDEELTRAGFSPTRFDRAHTPNGNWARAAGLTTVYGKRLGIIGLGEVGREVALRARGFDMLLSYTQRHRLRETEEQRYGAAYRSLDDLLAESDFISVHLPGGPATRGFIGAREFSLMKPGAILVNVSQPQLIERQALEQALAAGKLAGCGMDTFYEEPGDPHDPLLRYPGIVVTPHLGGSPRFNALEDFTEMLLNLAKAMA